MEELPSEELGPIIKMKHPPYHLRVNKSVDRLLLVETIRALGSPEDYQDFTYYSLAGPFLEDLRVIDHFFPKMRMISFEKSKHTHLRQEFHRFNSQLVLNDKPVAYYLDSGLSEDNKSIFWLDYTDLEFFHFGEFQKVLLQVHPGSIVRITLRAEPTVNLSFLEDQVSKEEIIRIKGIMEEDFRKKFLSVLPHEQVDAFAGPKNYARMVQLMVRRAASSVMEKPGSKLDFLPVQSTRYDDNTQMLSVTGIVCLRDNKASLKEKLSVIRFANFEWEEPTELNIPALSLKERLCLEAFLPVVERTQAGEVLHEALGYNIDDTASSSKKRLIHYAEYYRDYPHFVRMWD